MKRLIDLSLAFLLLILFLVPILFVCLLVRFGSKGPIFYWSERVGKYNVNFMMPKFRTMKIETPQLATHLLGDTQTYLTSNGSFLRKSSLDELPQLWSILKGDMSFVGPRPALYNQYDLIKMRTDLEIHTLKPGLTGWAQVNGRDEISIKEKVNLDQYYLKKRDILLDFKIIFVTIIKVFKRSGISH